MIQPTDRRRFLKTSTAVVAGTMWTLGQSTSAIEPIVRNGSPKFKFSLAAYSYRKLLQGASPQLTLADFIDDCAKMNLGGTELTSYYFESPTTEDYLRQLKQHCFRLGLDVSGTAVRCDFGFPAGEKREGQVAALKKWIDCAETLGAPVIRIFSGDQKEGLSAAKTHSLVVSGIEECCDYAGQHGVHLALENHGGLTTKVAEMLAIIRDVQSPWFGVNLDSGNFHNDTPYEDLTQIAPYALNVQIKMATSDESRQNKKPTDFSRLACILRDANYRGYIVLEYEEQGDPRVECPKQMAKVREAFA